MEDRANSRLFRLAINDAIQSRFSVVSFYKAEVDKEKALKRKKYRENYIKNGTSLPSPTEVPVQNVNIEDYRTCVSRIKQCTPQEFSTTVDCPDARTLHSVENKSLYNCKDNVTSPKKSNGSNLFDTAVDYKMVSCTKSTLPEPDFTSPKCSNQFDPFSNKFTSEYDLFITNNACNKSESVSGITLDNSEPFYSSDYELPIFPQNYGTYKTCHVNHIGNKSPPENFDAFTYVSEEKDRKNTKNILMNETDSSDTIIPKPINNGSFLKFADVSTNNSPSNSFNSIHNIHFTKPSNDTSFQLPVPEIKSVKICTYDYDRIESLIDQFVNSDEIAEYDEVRSESLIDEFIN